ncbi:MAG: nucleotide exchange factor GrpE [Spirochaetaceae bacterium]|jgi:molecular chaperone GrpE|nr:nucleotide exchange factor GrpE [Spirochaetaceae bacterium]
MKEGFNENSPLNSAEAAEGDAENRGENDYGDARTENIHESDAQNRTECGSSTNEAEKIAELERKLAELSDQYLRKAADFENFRKRIVKEKQDAIEFANQSLLLDLIAILDDFERAISVAGASAKTEADFDSFREGIVMIEKRLLSQLENKWGLKRYDSAGTPFDPERHEALFMEKSPDVSEPTVKEDFAKGYTLKDRVVRTAKVKVAMPETEIDIVDGGE